MNTKSQSVLLSLLLFSAFNPSHSLFAQGNLAPPGPPAPMFRTLEEVQPRRPIGTNATPGDANSLFVISQPGSYFLTTNITGVAGKHGIMIAASGVTLDLMGFEMVGVTNALDGITNTYPLNSFSNVVVRNGTIRDWRTGISLRYVSGSHYHDLRLCGNRSFGLSSGHGSTVVNCSATGNGDYGIFAQTATLISGCVARFNQDTGIYADQGSSVIGCVASANSHDGIFTYDGCTVNACTANNNDDNGITVENHCVVTACAASVNGDTGIFANGQSTINGCTANENVSYGIYNGEACHVMNNTVAFNGSGTHAVGISVTFAGSRLENNNVVRNGIGIQLSDPGNLVIRNSFSANGTNYVIVAGNKVGVTVTPPSTGAITGDTGGAGAGTTDPWANFSY
jgi:parallel beta-helix repeat protein